MIVGGALLLDRVANANSNFSPEMAFGGHAGVFFAVGMTA